MERTGFEDGGFRMHQVPGLVPELFATPITSVPRTARLELSGHPDAEYRHVRLSLVDEVGDLVAGGHDVFEHLDIRDLPPVASRRSGFDPPEEVLIQRGAL